MTLFLQRKAAALTLHIPATWKSTGSGPRFVDNGKPSQSNPGKVANKLHKTFSEKIDEDTFEQIESSRRLGGKLDVHDGFKKRNDHIAKSQYLIAFSWSDGEEPTKGGTLDTWSKCTGNKLHIPLSSVVNSPLKTFQEPSSSTELLDSVEVCKSLPTTHAEPISPPNQTSHISEEVSPSGATVMETPPCEYNSNIGSIDSGIGSIDSGVGSLDTSQSSSKLGKKPRRRGEGQNKRKRSESADISDHSDIECDGVAKEKIERVHLSVSKKIKVSEFAKQVLYS